KVLVSLTMFLLRGKDFVASPLSATPLHGDHLRTDGIQIGESAHRWTPLKLHRGQIPSRREGHGYSAIN
ncbi:hypothetical protein, partial [Burkholderia vietnamiensis]|uniref:hypothetical protein n=1 Tax=Burkholderia vietnamiensis TaxID=60552 RepID=UPI001E413EB0